MGRGNQTLFWQEWWIGEAPLKVLFPRLFSICTNPLATISSLGVWGGYEWHWIIPWRRILRPRDQEEKDAMFIILKSVTLDISRDDSWVWTSDKSGSFSVESATLDLAKSSSFVHQDIVKGIWRGLVPHRIEIFAWLSIMEKINTRSKLLKIGVIAQENSLCVLCNSHIETTNHLVIHCQLSWLLWSWWLDYWKLSWAQPSTIKEVFY